MSRCSAGSIWYAADEGPPRETGDDALGEDMMRWSVLMRESRGGWDDEEVVVAKDRESWSELESEFARSKLEQRAA